MCVFHASPVCSHQVSRRSPQPLLADGPWLLRLTRIPHQWAQRCHDSVLWSWAGTRWLHSRCRPPFLGLFEVGHRVAPSVGPLGVENGPAPRFAGREALRNIRLFHIVDCPTRPSCNLVLKRPDGPRVPPCSLVILVAMGCSRGPPTIDELAARAAARGYKRGAHRQRDELRGQEKHITSTKKNQEGTLHRYVL